MLFSIILLAPVVNMLLLPLASLAALATSEGITGRKEFQPHRNCYSNGKMFTDLGDWETINATVKAACQKFDDYSGNVFSNSGSGTVFQRCQRVGESSLEAQLQCGKGPSISLSMTYKGPSETFTPDKSNYKDGLTAYCWAAIEWALTKCTYGGTFENHQIGSDETSVGMQYWDVKLDPNSNGCC